MIIRIITKYVVGGSIFDLCSLVAVANYVVSSYTEVVDCFRFALELASQPSPIRIIFRLALSLAAHSLVHIRSGVVSFRT